MNQRERFAIASILAVVAVLVGFDIFTDSREGVALWHVLIEGLIAVVALGGVFYLLRGTVTLRHQLKREIESFAAFKKEADSWRSESRKYIDGLSLAIDQQLTKWNLTVAEKEVAFLLLKGLSLKEIADVRKTSEKTARAQSIAIYSKAGISGRSELSAFFLEDLLPPVARGGVSVHGMMLVGAFSLVMIFGSTGVAAGTVWDFVDSAVKSSPDILAKEAEQKRATAVSKSLSNPENPVVELGLSDRTGIGSSSRVTAWGVRQKLPFWTPKTRQADAQAALGEAAKWEAVATRREHELEIVRQIYLLGRLEAEQSHITDRRARFALIKSALEKTKAASPSQKVERRLIQSAVEIVEGQFERVESEVKSLRASLAMLSQLPIGNLKLKWLEASQLQSLKDRSANLTRSQLAEIKRSEAMLQSAQLELQATSPRPEFEIFIQSDREAGASEEKNFTAGLAATLPLNALWGTDRQAAEFHRKKVEAENLSAVRNRDRLLANSLLQLETGIKALQRFPIRHVRKVDSDVKEAEQQVRQSWITVSQFLEFDRQAHAQIEEVYAAQERAVEAVLSVCTVFECDIREFLGGSL